MEEVHASQLQPLTVRDNALIPGILSTMLSFGEATWHAEVLQMLARKVKADIEALYSVQTEVTSMAQILCQRVVRGEYV